MAFPKTNAQRDLYYAMERCFIYFPLTKRDLITFYWAIRLKGKDDWETPYQ